VSPTLSIERGRGAARTAFVLVNALLLAGACHELRESPEVALDAAASAADGPEALDAAPEGDPPRPALADAGAADAPAQVDAQPAGDVAPPPAVPTRCQNGTKDGDETDVDCGGATCGACELRRSCARAADCATGTCEVGACALASLRWETGASTELQHYALATASDGKLLYALGGGESGPTCAKRPILGRDCDHRSEVYDPGSGRWSLLPAELWTSVGRGLAAASDERGIIYLFGGAPGSGGSRGRPTYEAFAYLPGSPAWVELARMTTPRAYHAVGRAPDGSFVVVGGAGSGGTESTRQGCTDLIDRFVPASASLSVTPGSGTWTTIGRLPAGLCQPAVAPLPDGKLLVLGGREATAESFVYRPVDQVLLLDPLTGATERLAPLPSQRYALAAVAAPDGRIYVIGGRSGEEDRSVTAEVLAFDPQRRSFQVVAPLRQARSDLAAVIGPDLRIHVIGGLTEAGPFVPEPGRTTETYGPAINLFPSSASQSGTAVVITTASGGRFAPDADVEVFVDDPMGAPAARGRTGPDGNIAGRLELPIGARVPRGAHDVYVRDTRSRYPARARLTVVP
jgi:hypothetical protein